MNFSKRLFHILVISATFGLFSCETAPLEPQASDTRFTEEAEYIITASCEKETKTINDGIHTLWDEEDAISVFYDGTASYQSSRFDYDSENSFSGTLTLPSKDSDWYALYPYDQGNVSPDALQIVVNGSPVQNGNGSRAHLSGPCFPLYGTALDVTAGELPSFLMQNFLTAVKFVITNQEEESIVVKSIEFTTPVPVTGSFIADITGSAPSWKAVEGKVSNSITLSVENGTAIASGESAEFFLGMMPLSETGEFQIRVTATCGGDEVVSKKTVNTEMTFEAGKVNKVGYKFVAEKKDPQAKNYIKVTTTPKDWSGTYLIVSGSKTLVALSSNNGFSKADVTVTDNIIASGADVDKYALRFINAGKNTYDIINSEGKYFYCSNSTVVFDNDNKNASGESYHHSISLNGDGSNVIITSSRVTTNPPLYDIKYSPDPFPFTSGSFSYISRTSSSSGSNIQLYKLDDVQKYQSLSFEDNSVEWAVGEDANYQIGEQYRMPQEPSGARTSVNYSSSDPGVAEIVDNSWILVKSIGSTVITATAAANGEYNESTASYVLRIKENGAFNLESKTLSEYLDAAEGAYTDDNWSSVSVVKNWTTGKGGTDYDFPNPVSLTWPGSQSSYTVSVYNDPEMTKFETSVTTNKASADIFNLIPNRTYYYTVTDGSSNEVTSGKFKTEGRRRLLKISSTVSANKANNARDFGGLNTVYNKPLNYNVAFRGSNMNDLTGTERDIITDYLNVKMDIDLRGSDEGRVVLSNAGYSHAGFSSWTDLQNTSKIKTTFDDIIKTVTDGGAVYIHCYAGADRTGYICLLLEAVCGVSKKDCSIDYELTSFSVLGIRARSGEGNIYFTQGMEYIEEYSNGSFQENATQILLDAGIESDQIEALRKAMIKGY